MSPKLSSAVSLGHYSNFACGSGQMQMHRLRDDIDTILYFKCIMLWLMTLIHYEIWIGCATFDPAIFHLWDSKPIFTLTLKTAPTQNSHF